MQGFFKDLVLGCRSLRRRPGFTAAMVLILGLGIASITIVFSFVNAYLLRPLPFRDPGQLVHIWQTDPQVGSRELRVSVPNFLDWKRQASALDGLGGYFYSSYKYATSGKPVQTQACLLTPELFSVLGVDPVLGRTFRSQDAQGAAAAVISDGFWQREFSRSPQVLGRTIRLDDRPYTIVGVMPRSFVFPFPSNQVWLPLSLDAWKDRRETNGPLMVVGRLSPGHSIRDAQAELELIMKRLQEEYPSANAKKGANVVPLREALLFFHDLFQQTSRVLMLAVAFVLLIICANIGNLLLTRASGKSGEIAVRAALGAGRGRLVRGLLAESLLLALGGGILGSVLASLALAFLNPVLPGELYRVGTLNLDLTTLAFTFGVCAVAALLFGLTPALQATRLDLAEALKQGDRSGRGGIRAARLRRALVIGEVALAMVLLAGASLMIRTFFRLQSVNPGFNPDHLLTLELILPRSKYSGAPQTNQFYQTLLRDIDTLPGVRSASAVYPLPLNFETMGLTFQIAGREPATPGEKLNGTLFQATTGYFQSMEIPLLKGRPFLDRDTAEAQPVVIINQKMAQRYWPHENPLGRQILYGSNPKKQTRAVIVGVVGNSKTFQLSEEDAAIIYLPQLQKPTHRRFVMVRTEMDPGSLIPSVRSEVRSLDPDLPISSIRTMDRVIQESMGPWMIGISGLSFLGVGALLLAAMGIYGVMSYAVGQRMHEFGVRTALGARRADLISLVLKEGLKLSALGLILGLGAALLLTRALRAFLYGVQSWDPLTFLAAPLVLVAVALAACFVPARRSTRSDPARALRCE